MSFSDRSEENNGLQVRRSASVATYAI